MIWTIHDICHVLTSFSLLMFSWNKSRNFILAQYSLLSINSLLFVMKILGASLMQVSTCFKSASLIHFRSAGKYGDNGVLPPLIFGRYINPHPNRGAYYAHHIGLSPFNLKMFLQAWLFIFCCVMNFTVPASSAQNIIEGHIKHALLFYVTGYGRTMTKWYFVTKIVLTYCEKKIVLVIGKNFRNSRLKAENLQKFWDY